MLKIECFTAFDQNSSIGLTDYTEQIVYIKRKTHRDRL